MHTAVSGAAILAVTVGGVMAFGAPGASAHGEDGSLAVEVTPEGELAARVRARLVYLNDGDPAPGATVTAEGLGPAGQAVPPQPLSDLGEGIYEATLTFPVEGAWAVRLSATGPAAAAEAAVTVAPAPTTTTTRVPGTRPAAARGPAPNGDGGGGLFLVVAAVAVAGLAAGCILVLLRKRSHAGAPPSS